MRKQDRVKRSDRKREREKVKNIKKYKISKFKLQEN